MNNLNSILIEGNLVRDPVTKSVTGGLQICEFTIASNRYYKKETGFEKETSFFNIVTFGALAERTSEKGKKGRGVRVVGRLKQNRWTDAEGKNHNRIQIIAEHVEFRPEFKKDKLPENGEISADDERYEENDMDQVAVEEKELEVIPF